MNVEWDMGRDLVEKHGIYPLVMANIAIENGPVEIVSFPIKKM